MSDTFHKYFQEHFTFHIRYNNINFVRINNCPYCKRSRRINYDNNLRIEQVNERIEQSLERLENINRIVNEYNVIRDRNTPRINTINHRHNRNRGRNRINRRELQQHVEQQVDQYVERHVERHRPINRNRGLVVIGRQIDPHNLTYEHMVNFENVVVKSTLEDINKHSTIIVNNNPNHCRCVVCLNSITTNNIVRKIKCGHSFHIKCIDKWLETHNTCPICKYKLS